MNILVTGATGFIGRHLIRRLISENEHAVFGLTRNVDKISGSPEGVRYLPADITRPESLNNLQFPHPDIVYHCAAYVDNKPERVLYDTNVLGTKNVCAFALKRKVSRLIYLSSVAVVSGHDQVPLTEDMPYKATNAYGSSKIEAEKIMRDYRQKELPVVILRPPMVYGEDEPHLLGLLLFLLKMRVLPFLSRDDQDFHLAYVENVVEAMVHAAGDDRFLQGSYFVADEDVLSYKQVIACLCEGLGVRDPWHLPVFLIRALDIIGPLRRKKRLMLKPRRYSLDAIGALGFRPPYRARESLIRSARHYRREKV